MFRRLLIAAVLTMTTAGIASAYPVTLLLRGGERIVGDLTYKGGGEVTLDGRDYPFDQVAVIAFISNDPTPTEVSRVPVMDNNPSELERHVFAMRDGRLLFGKLYKFAPDAAIITYDPREGGRRDISASDIARIYINPGTARSLYAPILAALNTNTATSNAVGTSGATVTVPGNQQWMATGFNVRRGETLRFNASGEVMWTPEAADRALPGGALNRRKSGQPPVGEAPGGALVARIDNGRPFLIGNQATVRMPANGQLFLGINDDVVSDNTGNFTVTISR